MILYEQISPTTDFNFSLQVNAATLQGFAIMLRSNLPFAGSTAGVNYQLGGFELWRWTNQWTGTSIGAVTQQNVWYTMTMNVYSNPFRIEIGALDENGTSLGVFSASDMTNLDFNNTNYLGFGVLESGGNYTVRNISGVNIPIPSRQWVVDSSGTGDFTSIQTAINSAYHGDSIYVKNATYYEHLTINKTLSLFGENKQTTIIDGGGVDLESVIVVNAYNVTISGFTIRNSRSGGNAIWIESFNSTRISNNIISNNGDGIRVLHSYGNIISNNIVKDNPDTAIGFNWAFNNTVENNEIFGNYIGIGGGFEPCYGNIFFRNNFTSNGIAVQVDFSNSKFYNNIFSANAKQVDVYTSTFNASWDDGYPSGGNYWSDYTGIDANHDGIGDTPYIIDANNQDNYPLVSSSSGLIANWKIDEGNGDTIFDSSGNNYQGTIQGASWIETDGNTALSFNGVSDYVSIPSLSVSNINSLTVSAWIKSDFSKTGYIFYHGDTGEFLLHNGERFSDGPVAGRYPNIASFSVKLAGSTWYDVYSNSLEPNVWHQIVGVWEKGNSLKIYVDGVLAGQNTAISSDYLLSPGSYWLPSLGVYNRGAESNTYYKGLLSNVMVYNKALTSQEISRTFIDDFNSYTLDNKWMFIDPSGGSTADLSSASGFLRMATTSPPYRDLYSPINFNAPRLMLTTGGNFTIETSLNATTVQEWESAGLLVWKDSSNFLRLDRACGASNSQRIVFIMSKNGSWDPTDVLLQSALNPTFLKIERTGEKFSGYYSNNGLDWTLVGEKTLPVADPLDVGLDVVNVYHVGTFFADFDYFRMNSQSQPNPTPTPTPSPEPTAFPTPTPTATATPTPSPAPSPHPTTTISPTASPTSTPAPTTNPAATLELSCSSSVSYDSFRVEINGRITENNNGIVSQPIAISYSVTNGKTWQDLTSVTTDSDGSFSAVWTPLVTGNYMIRASWVLDDSVNAIVNLALLPFTDSVSKNVFSVASNSTISDLAFNSTSNQLSFTVTGETGTFGYTDVTVAKNLIKDITKVQVYIDGIKVQTYTTETTDSWLLHFTYQHSTHEVTLQLSSTSTTSTSGNQYILYAVVGSIFAVVLIATLLILRKRSKKT